MIRSLENAWILETENTAYAIGLTPSGFLVNTHWGVKLGEYPEARDRGEWASFSGEAMTVPQEFPAWQGRFYAEPCLKTTFTDGVRDTWLAFHSAVVDGDHLTIALRDRHYPLGVELHYRAYEEYDLIERWVRVFNDGKDPILLERLFSAMWRLPVGGPYRFSHLHGKWYDEYHLVRETLTPGVKTLESRRGTSSHDHAPWFALDLGMATEIDGEVWFGTLQWSGNWKLAVEVDSFGRTQAAMGLGDWDFAWNLEGGQSFEAPSCFAGYTARGFGEASRRLHDFARDRLLPHGAAPRKVLYNSWNASGMDIDEMMQMRLAETAAGLGAELFVVDDGWFHRRHDDQRGLGDWWPDEERFPNGLKPLIDKVKSLAMEFGLWVEPEMVSEDSELFRAHPDWAIQFPTRPRTTGRNQLVLNFARREVQDHVIEVIDNLLSGHDVAFVKWDMNRSISEPGLPNAKTQREIWARYTEGVYRVWETLRERHPNIVWQACSGGGGRADFGILRQADQVWISDNAGPTARLGMQFGYTQFMPPITMECWVEDSEAEFAPLEFRFHTAMLGALGLGMKLPDMSEEDRSMARRMVRDYKEIRHLVEKGDLFRLTAGPSPGHDEWFSAWQFVAKDRSEGVLFAFRTLQADPTPSPAIRLAGLDPAATYEVEGLGSRSGAGWIGAPVTGLFERDWAFASCMRRIRRT